MTSQTIISPVVMLKQPSDWTNWIRSIQSYAADTGSWKYCNPNSTDKLKEQPTALTKEEKAELGDEWLEEWRDRKKEHRDASNALMAINRRIRDTVGLDYQSTLKIDGSCRENLIALKAAINYSDYDIQKANARELARLEKGIGRSDVSKWITDWRNLHEQVKSIDDPFLPELRLCDAFIGAVASDYQSFSETWLRKFLEERNKPKEEQTLKLMTILNDFQVIQQAQARARKTTSHVAFSAQLTSPQDRKPCLCGNSHKLTSCFYLNPKVRPNPFTYRFKASKNMQESLKKDPNIKEKINKAFKTANLPLPLWEEIEEKIKEATNQAGSQQQANSSSNDEKKKEMNFISVAMTISDLSMDDYPYKHSFHLDSASTTHICYDSGRFVTMRPPKPNEPNHVCCGTSSVQIEAYGEVKLTIDGVDEPLHITLDHVAYIPKFHLNLVSTSKMEQKGVFVRPESNTLAQNGKEFAHIYKVGGFRILDRNPLDFPDISPRREESLEASFNFSVISARPHETKATKSVWHRRLGHTRPEVIDQLEANTDGVKVLKDQEASPDVCEGCKIAYLPRQVSRTPMFRGNYPFEKIHMDLMQFHPATNGDVYLFHMYCAFSHFHFVFTIDRKTTKKLMNCIEEATNLVYAWGFPVRYFQLDPEAGLRDEFETPFRQFTRQRGITVLRAPVANKEANGSAERSGGVIAKKIRAILLESKLPQNLWNEIADQAARMLNRLPVQRLGWMTPFERVTKRKPSLAGMRIPGSKAYVKIDYENRKRDQKVSAQAHIGFYIGCNASNIYRIWIPSEKKIISSRDVVIDETVKYNPLVDKIEEVGKKPDLIWIVEEPERPQKIMNTQFLHPISANKLSQDQAPVESNPMSNQPSNDMITQAIGKDTGLLTPESSRQTTPLPPNEEEPTINSDETPIEPIPDVIEPPIEQESQPIEVTNDEQPLQAPATRQKRHYTKKLTEEEVISNLRQSSRADRAARRRAHEEIRFNGATYLPLHKAYSQAMLSKAHRDTVIEPPKDWKALLNHPYHYQFKEAARDEFNRLKEKDTFHEVNTFDCTPGAQILPLKWVFTYKFDEFSFVKAYKARLCVRGDMQAPTSEDLYASTGAMRTFRILMALVAAFDLICLQMDAVTAFINADLDETIYARFPHGFEQSGQCLLLKKALYGLRKSPLLWYEEISDYMKELGFVACPEEPCLYVHQEKLIIVFIYVDDFLLISPKSLMTELSNVKASLMTKYDFRDLGEATQFLNIKIIRDRPNRKLWLSQEDYMDKIMSKFKLEEDTDVTTPLSHHIKLTPYDKKATPDQIQAYQQRVGTLLYPAIVTRPDVAYAASKLSQFNTNPSTTHRHEAERAMKYLYNTKKLAIEYTGTPGPTELVSLDENYYTASDASFADSVIDRKSTQGWLISLFGGLVAWQSSKQKTVTTSTTEAELLAMSKAASEMMAMNRLLDQIGLEIDEKSNLYCDNAQTVGLITKEKPQLVTKLRHVDTYHFWLRQANQAGSISVQWIPTNEMPADGLTKALPRQKHVEFVNQLRLRDITNVT
jgi:hypothetical protein